MPAWNKIKKEYLEGVRPAELAKKYKTTSSAIRSKANREKWGECKATICDNTQQNVEERIKTLSNVALDVAESVMVDPESSNKDKLTAAKIVIDVSGLKIVKQEVTQKGINIVVADKEHKKMLEDL